MKNTLRPAIAYGLYPLLLAATLAQIALTLHFGWNLRNSMLYFLPSLLLFLILMETWFPMRPEWGMTWRGFWRDSRYLVLDAAVIGGTRAAFGLLAIHLSQRYPGPLEEAPVLVAVPLALLAWDLVQYALHRYSHEGRGPVARFLWDAHLAHHLPDGVYVVMHGVFHPVNAFLNAMLLQGVFLGLGLSPEAAFAAMMLIDLQTILSHFNVDVRAGWFNYLFIGTELHRNHHRADFEAAGNYGSILSVWDLVFGTFRYFPGRPPATLGVAPDAGLPRSEEVAKVLAHPFRRRWPVRDPFRGSTSSTIL